MTELLLAAVIVVALVLAVRWRVAARRASELDNSFETFKSAAARDVDILRAELAKLEAHLSRLSKWENVANAEDAAADMLRRAQVEADILKNHALDVQRAADAEAATIRRDAEEAAEAIRQDAKAKAAKLSTDAEARLADAEARAARLVETASRKAEEIAGDALRAVNESKALERTVQALRNVIEGYGDQYVIPTHTLLDDLAEGFAHTDAGQKLKIVREHIRDAVRDGKAATCDYVEENRRGTAVRFVVDAFNGKVDSILARVRQDNFGKLQQGLRDAFSLVNHNGKAFRNARINESYLALREEELRWATVVNELKQQEREEQRRIKEQIREEEKARREYERAMRETAREEELVRKAMEKAEAQLARATEEQKSTYELQLQELRERLTQAEERSQRALSMAQQTRRGHVYIISNVGSFGEDVYKIGLTRRLEPLDRVRELGDSSVPFEFDVHALIFAENAPAVETQLHRHFLFRQLNKVNHRKEFFRVTVRDIRDEITALGLAASWTMTAAAKEYRESLAIEKAIAEDPLARAAWPKRQLLLDPVDLTADAEVEKEMA
ncbi:MAG: DUF4041 domain-containing protein [Vicinamibacteraceae bacterium]